MIDVNSRFAYARCLKNKTGLEVTNAFKNILTEDNKPQRLQVDRGTEFYNKTFLSYLKQLEIEIFSNYSEFKAALIERFNGTLLTRISKHFTVKNTKTYCDVLDDIIHSYNSCVHRITKLRPCNVDKSNELDAWYNSNKDVLHQPQKKPRFKVGQPVRIIKMKSIFDKGYAKRFTDEIYFVASVVPGCPIAYKVKNSQNDVMNGIFYESELVRVIL